MAASRPDIEAIFSAARLTEPADRAAFLNEVCGDDALLRGRIERFLDAQSELGSFLETSAGAERLTIDPPPVAEHPGTMIGPYKLLEPIGEGGMGTVWMAQQIEPIKRRVAIKLIKSGMDSEQVLARFDAERQALALMDHPNIAKVFDAGAVGSGQWAVGGDKAESSSSLPTAHCPLPTRPFFVMELVKGVPITKYCDEHHLTPRQRLELFIPVCHAIQHAHQKGIIHRDIKPSNVLVAIYDDRPVPKVIDFGLAKATGQQLTEASLHTNFGSVVGTLEYMSPEQANFNQLDVDTRSDIYSLGVLLYELLAGSPPFTRKDLEKAGVLEMLRVIREQEPSKPSNKLSSSDALPSLSANRGTEPSRLTKLVRGELDWIVMKTLEKDRSRRYETANGFALDLQRYLADEAVQACPPSVGYRLRKFVRRNKAAVAVAALVLFFLVLLGSGIGWAVRDRAARQANVAGQVVSILAEVERLEREQKWPEALAAARRAETAVTSGEADSATTQRVRGLLKDLEFIDRLEQIRMEHATSVDGSFNYAGTDRSYAQAFRDYGVDVDELPVETSIQRLASRPALAIPLAAAMDAWVFARFKVSQQDAADWKRLMDIARGIDPDPLRVQIRSTWPVSNGEELRRLAKSIDIRPQLPETLVSLAGILHRSKREEAALQLLREAQAVYPGDYWLNFELGSALNKQKDFEGAVRYFTAAVAIRPNSAAAHINLGDALGEQNKLDDAVACLSKAIDLDPKSVYAHHNLANILRRQKKLDEALVACRKAIDLDPKPTHAYTELGRILHAQKQLDDAIAAFRKAIEIDPKDAGAYEGIARILFGQKKMDEAIAQFQEAIKANPQYASAYSGLGTIFVGQNKPDEAIDAFRKAIEVDPNDTQALQGLGTVWSKQKKWDDAVAAYRKAIDVDSKDAGSYVFLGMALRDQGKLDEAIAAFRKTIELDPNFPNAYYELGLLLKKQGKLDEAIAIYHKAIVVNPKHSNAYAVLGTALRGQKKLDEAIVSYRKAIELDPQNVFAYSGLGLALKDDQKKLDETIAAFRKVIELDPNFPGGHLSLGLALQSQQKLDEASAAFRKAIELNSQEVNAHYCLGAILCEHLREYANAAACFRKVIEFDSKHARAYSGLGTALRGQNKVDDAIVAYRKAIELDPKYASSHNSLGAILCDIKHDYDGALASFRQAIELKPDYAEAWTNLGNAHGRLKQHDEAIAAFRKAINLAPKSASAYNGLGVSLQTQGKLDESNAAYRKAIELVPNYLNAHLNLVRSLKARGKNAEAIAASEEMIRLLPKSAPAANDFAWLLATCPDPKLRDGARAVELARKAVELAPMIYAFRRTLGVAQYRAGNWKEAVAALQKSMELRKGGDGFDWFFLAMAHCQLGDKEAARAWYAQAVAWTDKFQPTNEELRRFQTESSELLEIKKK